MKDPPRPLRFVHIPEPDTSQILAEQSGDCGGSCNGFHRNTDLDSFGEKGRFQSQTAVPPLYTAVPALDKGCRRA